MSIELVVSMLLVAVVLLASARFARGASGFAVGRSITVLFLQSLAALLLYFTLFPPAVERAAGRLVLATASTTQAQVDAQSGDALVLALPEAPAIPGLLRVPDLGTALRQHPQTQQLRVLGVGLVPRDRDAARGRSIEFDAAPLPRGVVELWPPTQAIIGASWHVSGRVQDVVGGTVELIDPAGVKGEVVQLDADGKFTLHGQAPAPGFATFTLRVRDARAQLVEAIALPITMAAGAAPRVLVLAGGPDPELKYLRRWAKDAGATLQTQIALGAGLTVGDAVVAIDAPSLRGFDLLVLDERAWRALGAGRKAAVAEALRAGLGVMMRVTGPLSQAERREFSDYGFSIKPADVMRTVSLPARQLGASDADTAEVGGEKIDGGALQITRQPLRVEASDAIALVEDDVGEPLVLWRSVGQGRMAVSWMGGTYQLVLSGEAAAHGQLWSDAFATLARARDVRRPWIATENPRLRQRVLICGLGEEASIESTDGTSTPLLLADSPGAGNCAAYWPHVTGRHLLHINGAKIPFTVRAEGEAPGLAARANAIATAQLISSIAGESKSLTVAGPGQRWPWFLGWLLVSALSWRIERRYLRSFATSWSEGAEMRL